MVKTLNPMHNKNKFKLGIFAFNCASGVAVTKVKERWVNSWENNLKVAQLADEAGLEYLLPVARWVSCGGEGSFHSNTLEVITWTAALLTHTRQISVVSTIHTSLHNPVVLAKQLTTMDHISNGRIGLNMVCGWVGREYEALGSKLYEHEERYQHAQEWLDIMKKLWREDKPFDWNSQYFNLEKAYSIPSPLQKNIPVFNATDSETGRNFAIQNTDYLFMFTSSIDKLKKDILDIKQQEKLQNRKTPLNYASFSQIVCRPTRKEAEEYLHYYSQENADWEAVDYILGDNSKSRPKEEMEAYRSRFAAAHGGQPLVGTPDDIAEGIKNLYNAGLSGTALTFVNYIDEFPYFRDEVLPRLEKRGLREKF